MKRTIGTILLILLVGSACNPSPEVYLEENNYNDTNEEKDIVHLYEIKILSVNDAPRCEIKWSYPIYGVLTGGGVALDSEGTIYAGTSEGFIYAIYPDGSTKWTKHFEIEISDYKEEQIDPEALGDISLEKVPDSIIVPEINDVDDFSHSSPTLSPMANAYILAGGLAAEYMC